VLPALHSNSERNVQSHTSSCETIYKTSSGIVANQSNWQRAWQTRDHRPMLRGRVVNTPASYSEGFGLKSRPGHRLSKLRFFVVFPSPSGRKPEHYLEIRSRQLPFKSFPIYHSLLSPYHSTLVTYWNSVVKNYKYVSKFTINKSASSHHSTLRVCHVHIFHFSYKQILNCPEDGDSMFLLNVGIYLRVRMASRART
jgi:hypothetical protein